ncbi:FAD-dependent oxidoreductase [Cystobacter fuscus]
MKPSTHRFGQAVIIGGSIAGLLSARVLADHFDKVLVLEREPFPEGPEARKSTPQGRHIHAVLEAGLKTMEGLFPGLRRELETGGVEFIDMARDAAWLQSGSWKARYEGDIETILVSRPFLEWKIRGRVAALPNVELRTGYGVEELVLDASRTRAVGVKVKGPEGEQEIPGALIVDTSGRGSRAPQWLEELGFGQVEQEQVRIDLGYTSRLYERPRASTRGRSSCSMARRPRASARASSPTWREGGGSSASTATSVTTRPRTTRASWSSRAACPRRPSTSTSATPGRSPPRWCTRFRRAGGCTTSGWPGGPRASCSWGTRCAPSIPSSGRA